MQKVEFISFERQKVRFKHFFYALTKKYARMETALLQTFVVHHISPTFPMDNFIVVRDLPTNIYTSPLAGYRPTCRTCPHMPFTPMRISVGCCAITIRLSSLKLNITVFWGQRNQPRRNGKAACFGWLHHSHAHTSQMLHHNYTVVLIQIEHNYFWGQR